MGSRKDAQLKKTQKIHTIYYIKKIEDMIIKPRLINAIEKRGLDLGRFVDWIIFIPVN